ncbi:MAG: hypothetical protein ACREP8_17605, partial [Candidatus Binatia bacterium]
DEDPAVRGGAVSAITQHILSELGSRDCLALALKVEERLDDKNPDIRAAAARVLEKTIPHLEARDRLTLLATIFFGRSAPQGDAARVVAGLLQKVSPESLLNLARSKDREDLFLLARYHEAHIPFDPVFYREFLNAGEWRASDREWWLQKTSRELEPYRRGRPVASLDERELRFAYAGLDAPEGLTFEEFVRRIQDGAGVSLPPVFLDQGFQAPVPLVRSFHQLINKGMVRDALAPLETVQDAERFRRYLNALMRQGDGALRNIKADIQAAFPQGLDHQTMDGAKDLLRKLAAKRRSPPAQDLMLHTALFLALQREGTAELQKKILRVRGENIPSDTLWEGLQATEEFYGDALNEVFRELGIADVALPFVERQRRLLAAERERVQKAGGGEVAVEFIPSKGPADRFFGYVGEDCNKDAGDAIERKDFQVYR